MVDESGGRSSEKQPDLSLIRALMSNVLGNMLN